MKKAAVVTHEIDHARLIADLRQHEFGAIAVFLGTVRETSDGRDVTGLEYTAYVAMAEEEMQRILDECESRLGVSSIVVEHRVGALQIGNVSIAIVAAHQHRDPALEATRFVIDEIKRRVPIWKREHYADGTREWVDPTRAIDRAGV